MSDSMRVQRVLNDVDFVAAYWPDLYEARHPGTRRRWAQTRTRAESRRHATALGDGALSGLSKAPAPCHLDVLDDLVDVLAVSHTLSDAVAQLAGVDRLPPPASAYADPRPYLKLVTDHLHDAVDADDGWLVDEALNRNSDMSIVRARDRTATGLRLILSGQVLDADCPWCQSRPLKIEIHAEEPLVVCRSRRICQPAEADCGTWVHRRPAWIRPEWEWLAQRIRHAEERAS